MFFRVQDGLILLIKLLLQLSVKYKVTQVYFFSTCYWFCNEKGQQFDLFIWSIRFAHIIFSILTIVLVFEIKTWIINLFSIMSLLVDKRCNAYFFSQIGFNCWSFSQEQDLKDWELHIFHQTHWIPSCQSSTCSDHFFWSVTLARILKDFVRERKRWIAFRLR